MRSTVCTLFEGNYHYGLGALVNSLYKNGYRGSVWAGYRGSLPQWATPIREKDGYKEFEVAEGCSLRFVLLETKKHFTNVKPELINKIFDVHQVDADAVFYFDPDIVVKFRWTYFEEWCIYGVALCEDWCTLNALHPLRTQWSSIAGRYGLKRPVVTTYYVNAGFIGIHRQHRSMLNQWQQMLDMMQEEIGKEVLERQDCLKMFDRSHPFPFMDQDALNMCLMFLPNQYSIAGRDAMSFAEERLQVMSHAIGSPKPWQKKYLLSALSGFPPKHWDRSYFDNIRSPLNPHKGEKVGLGLRLLDFRAASFVGRFIHRW